MSKGASFCSASFKHSMILVSIYMTVTEVRYRKSAFLHHVSRSLGCYNSMVILHIDDSLDSKSLLGTYVCGEDPGTFVWQPGSLTQAAVEGV